MPDSLWSSCLPLQSAYDKSKAIIVFLNRIIYIFRMDLTCFKWTRFKYLHILFLSHISKIYFIFSTRTFICLHTIPTSFLDPIKWLFCLFVCLLAWIFNKSKSNCIFLRKCCNKSYVEKQYWGFVHVQRKRKAKKNRHSNKTVRKGIHRRLFLVFEIRHGPELHCLDPDWNFIKVWGYTYDPLQVQGIVLKVGSVLVHKLLFLSCI